jgi:hypothetical protein
MGEIFIYPFLKRFVKENGKLDPEKISQEEIDTFSYYMMTQLVKMLELHEFQLDSKFFQDFELVHDSFKSAVMRTVGKYHAMQDMVDSMNEEETDDNAEEN